jgi:hypothetical protein
MNNKKLITAAELIDAMYDHFAETRSDWSDYDCREGTRKAAKANTLILEVANQSE